MYTADEKHYLGILVLFLLFLFGCYFFCQEKITSPISKSPVVSVLARQQTETEISGDIVENQIEAGNAAKHFPGNNSDLRVGVAGILLVLLLIIIRLYVHAQKWKP